MSALDVLLKANKNQLMELNTPCYVYCPEIAIQNYKSLKECLGAKLIVSVKANSNADVIAFLSNQVDGFEATSEEELKTIAQVVKGERYINNPSMQRGLIAKSVASKTTVIIDHPSQFYRSEEELEGGAKILLRINATSLFSYYGCKVKHREDHFGMSVEDAIDLSLILKEKNVQLEGIHLFKGSYSFESTAVDTIESVKLLLSEIEDAYGSKLKKVNLGGGFSGDWYTTQFDFSEYREKLNALLTEYEIYHESGRAIFESSGVFVCEVLSKKELNEKSVVITNGGLSQSFLLAQTETPIKRHKSPVVVGDNLEPALKSVKIVGSTCNKDDIIGKIEKGELEPDSGSILLFENCGAYTQTYSPINFLGLPKAHTYIYFEPADLNHG